MTRSLLMLWTIMVTLVAIDDVPGWFGFPVEHWAWRIVCGLMGGTCAAFGYLLSRVFADAQRWREQEQAKEQER